MKWQFIAAFFLLVLAFTSCKKVSGPANGKSVQPNNHLDTLVGMTALVNNANWTTDSATGYIVRNSGNDSGVQNLMITATQYGSNNSYSTIVLNVTNFTGINTYIINTPEISAMYYMGSNRFVSQSGQVAITSYTAYGLTGTFSFKADSFRVTNGVFNVAQP